jgi:hypothetical protein
MKYNTREIKFPAKMNLSFSKLMDSLEERRKNGPAEEALYLKKILDKANKVPELRDGIDQENIEEYQGIIDELMSTIFPAVLTDNELKCATFPWNFKPFYTSARLGKYGVNGFENFGMDQDVFTEDQMYISACSAILGIHFGRRISGARPFYMKLPDPVTGRMGHYRMAMNGDFMSVRRTERSLDITEADYHELIDNYHDIDLWKKKFPEGSWIFSGFMITSLMDLTIDWNINKLSSVLLNVRPEGPEELRKHISELLKIDDLSLSFVRASDNKLIRGDKGKMMPNLMLGEAEEISYDDVFCSHTFKELVDNDSAVAFPDVDRYAKESKSVLGKNLVEAGLKSYYLQPMVYQDVKLGFLELGSRKKGVLNSATSLLLEQVIPILAVAGNRFNEEHKNRIEAVIQEECTTIHPSVKWRFEEEANKHIAAHEGEGNHQFTDLVFKDVYPLYGQLDISGSSTLRNESVKKDLVSQLLSVKNILEEAQKVRILPVYEELLFVADNYIIMLETNMDAASEHDIQRFLLREIEPILPQLAKLSKKLKAVVEAYNNSINEELHILYQERKAFDESVANLNGVLANFLDKKQEEAQLMFPHYFERFKTDGVEFNMYIGESITPNKDFGPLMLKNLRLWQLMVMVEMEQEFHGMRETLKKDLKIASLILAQRSPLTIQFRLDEKQFDVDGAYNARYEIIKKRIDKSHIKGTTERLTEVGKIVIIYTNDEDEAEYLRYIQFLQNKGYFTSGPPEILAVEDLQGISGLKALRVGINFNSAGSASSVSMEEIIAEIEGKETLKK